MRDISKARKSHRAYSRLTLLNYRGVFSRIAGRGVSFLTITQRGYKSASALKSSRDRVIRWLKRSYGLKYYITASEYQARGSLHYHMILFDVPYIPYNKIVEKWGEGEIQIQYVSDVSKAIAYLISYFKKSLRLSYSYSFKEFVPFSNYTSLVRYDKGGFSSCIVSDVIRDLDLKDISSDIVKMRFREMLKVNKHKRFLYSMICFYGALMARLARQVEKFQSAIDKTSDMFDKLFYVPKRDMYLSWWVLASNKYDYYYEALYGC